MDATNAPAVKLYVDLGFVVNHLDQAYVGDIAPAPLMPGRTTLSRAELAALLSGRARLSGRPGVAGPARARVAGRRR